MGLPSSTGVTAPKQPQPHPCIIDVPSAWQPLSRAQVMMLAIQLQRLRRVRQSHQSWLPRES